MSKWEMRVTRDGAVVKGDSKRDGYADEWFSCECSPPSLATTENPTTGSTKLQLENIAATVTTQHSHLMDELGGFHGTTKLDKLELELVSKQQGATEEKKEKKIVLEPARVIRKEEGAEPNTFDIVISYDKFTQETVVFDQDGNAETQVVNSYNRKTGAIND